MTVPITLEYSRKAFLLNEEELAKRDWYLVNEAGNRFIGGFVAGNWSFLAANLMPATASESKKAQLEEQFQLSGEGGVYWPDMNGCSSLVPSLSGYKIFVFVFHLRKLNFAQSE